MGSCWGEAKVTLELLKEFCKKTLKYPGLWIPLCFQIHGQSDGIGMTSEELVSMGILWKGRGMQTTILDPCNLLGEFSLGPAGEHKSSYCTSNLTQDLAQGMTCGFLVFPPAGMEIGSKLLPWPFCRLLKLKLLILENS